jgi:hypothetical protein
MLIPFILKNKIKNMKQNEIVRDLQKRVSDLELIVKELELKNIELLKYVSKLKKTEKTINIVNKK